MSETLLQNRTNVSFRPLREAYGRNAGLCASRSGTVGKQPGSQSYNISMSYGACREAREDFGKSAASFTPAPYLYRGGKGSGSGKERNAHSFSRRLWTGNPAAGTVGNVPPVNEVVPEAVPAPRAVRSPFIGAPARVLPLLTELPAPIAPRPDMLLSAISHVGGRSPSASAPPGRGHTEAGGTFNLGLRLPVTAAPCSPPLRLDGLAVEGPFLFTRLWTPGLSHTGVSSRRWLRATRVLPLRRLRLSWSVAPTSIVLNK
jgi:hypothetical protein